MHTAGYRAVKSPVCVKKTKMAHKFFVTKATDLKIIFLKSPWKMNVETCHDICLKNKTKNYILLPFFLAFFQPSLAPKLLKLSV